jgi:hypothetical protein
MAILQGACWRVAALKVSMPNPCKRLFKNSPGVVKRPPSIGTVCTYSLTRDFASSDAPVTIIRLFQLEHPFQKFIEFNPEEIKNAMLGDPNIHPMTTTSHTISMQSTPSHRKITAEVMIDTCLD